MDIKPNSINLPKKVCVTGAAGFLGKAIVVKLSECGFEVLALSRQSTKNQSNSELSMAAWFSGSVEDWEVAIKQFKPEIIISCDWSGVNKEDRDTPLQNLNCDRVARLGKLAIEVEAKLFLTFGSQAETSPSEDMIPENCPELPQSNYGSSKIQLKKILRHLAENSETKFIWGRIFTIYGPGDRRKSVLTESVKSAISHNAFTIQNPNLKWSFLYIDDFTDAVLKILSEYDLPDIINIGNQAGIELGVLPDIILEALGTSLNSTAIHDEASPQQNLTWIPETKTLSSLGWKPKTPFKLGIQKTVDWWRVQLDIPC